MWLVALLSCAAPPADTSSDADPLVVSLRWVGGTTLLDWPSAEAGLWWSLSSLGALPSDTAGALVIREERADRVRFELDLGALGFPAEALPTLQEVAAELQSDPSVDQHGGVDVGRFLMRTLHEPWRYYALTGACGVLSDWEESQQSTSVGTYAVTSSLLVSGERLIELNVSPASVSGIAFRSMEISGDLAGGAFEVHELEVIDVMPNGRQRYAVYGVDGALRPASDPAVSPAGQPGRCLWCHEGALMVGQPNPTVKGYWSYDAFAEELAAQGALLSAHRAALETVVDFEDRAVHTWGELLVEEFLFPTPARVALEWGIPEGAVRAMGLPSHESAEYPDWGPVYWRSDVDALLAEREGWRPVETLSSGRELDPWTAELVPASLRDCRDVR